MIAVISLWKKKKIVVSKGGESFSCVYMLLGFYSFECVEISACIWEKQREGSEYNYSQKFFLGTGCLRVSFLNCVIFSQEEETRKGHGVFQEGERK